MFTGNATVLFWGLCGRRSTIAISLAGSASSIAISSRSLVAAFRFNGVRPAFQFVK
jgi:hypothetical protein